MTDTTETKNSNVAATTPKGDNDLSSTEMNETSSKGPVSRGKMLLEKAKKTRVTSEGAANVMDRVKKAAEATRSKVTQSIPRSKSSGVSTRSGTEPSDSSMELNLSPETTENRILGSAEFTNRSEKTSPMDRMKQTLRRRSNETPTNETTTDDSDEVQDETHAKPETDSPKVKSSIQFKEDNVRKRMDQDVRRESNISVLTDDSAKTSRFRVDVAPFVAFFLRDSFIIISAAVSIAMVPTSMYWESIAANEIPKSVSISWMLVAFLVGREMERVHGSGELVPQTVRIPAGEQEGTEKEFAHEEITKQNKKQSGPTYTIFSKATSRFSKIKFRIPGQNKEQETRAKTKKKKFWTNLNKPKKEAAPKSTVLLRRLYRDPSLRRQPSTSKRLAMDNSELEPVLEDEEETKSEGGVGTFDLGDVTADTLSDLVVKPVFKLRGMDVFLADESGATDNLGDHPFLIEGGLRDVKTCMVNIMLQWANVVIYFEVPDYITDKEHQEEKEDDPDDVKALKRFINGDDDYKNKRLKIIPSLVDGPRIIKYLSPPRKELTLSSPIMPVSYVKKQSRMVRGQQQQLLVEVELDCMAHKAMRGMANIVKRNLSGVVIDLAVIIQKPDGSTQDEPSAVLGMWRFDRVDITECPMLPPERAVSEEEIVRRATVAMTKMTPEQLAQIETETE